MKRFAQRILHRPGRTLAVAALLAPLCLVLTSLAQVSVGAELWPQWRGPNQTGVAPGSGYPLHWNESSDSPNRGVQWKTELPGDGGSTPVVAGDTAFITAGVEGKNTLLAIGLDNGMIRWQTDLGEDRGNKHRKGSGSNPSAVTDGESVFAYFRSGDLACVNMQGDVVWTLNLQDKFGEDTLWWDLGTSPLLTEDAIVVAVMQTGPSYLAAFDKASGKLLWKTERMLGAPKEAAQSYTTPLAVQVNGQAAIAVMGADHLTLHAVEDGREIARLGGFNPGQEQFFRSISSPVAVGSVVVCPYARGATLTGVDMNALANEKGDEAVLWKREDFGSDVPTPAAQGEHVYVVSDSGQSKGVVAGLDLKTGKTQWEVQLPKSRMSFSSSPLVADDRLYVTQEDAVTYVIGPLSSEQPKVLATNVLADDDPYTVASPVPAGDGLLLRTQNYLYYFAEE